MPLSREVLEQFPALVFVETGSHQGEGIQCALDAGFECIYSVEVDSYCYGYCCHRFKEQRTKVNLFHADSREFLRKILPALTTRATFWLDAHSCEAPQGRRDDPLIEELNLIAEHPIKNHNILIDDVRNLGTPRLSATIEEVLTLIAKINPAYQVRLLNSTDFAFDILAAYL